MAHNSHEPERDELTGVETTGHDWDGIKELNNPLPRWWLYTLCVTIVWAVIYTIFSPAYPLITDYTKGLLGRTERSDVHKALKLAQAEKTEWIDKLQDKTLQEIEQDSELMGFVMSAGGEAFANNCSACHGAGGQGSKGYPNLRDDDWLWGGDVDQIYQTIKIGIRSSHPDTRTSEMPAFGRDGILETKQRSQVADYILSLSQGQGTMSLDDLKAGKTVYDENCASCHGEKAEGNLETGIPKLSDDIWLYGGTKADIMRQVYAPRHGVMPTWEGKLSDATIKILAVYVHQMSGGETYTARE